MGRSTVNGCIALETPTLLAAARSSRLSIANFYFDPRRGIAGEGRRRRNAHQAALKEKLAMQKRKEAREAEKVTRFESTVVGRWMSSFARGYECDAALRPSECLSVSRETDLSTRTERLPFREQPAFRLRLALARSHALRESASFARPGATAAEYEEEASGVQRRTVHRRRRRRRSEVVRLDAALTREAGAVGAGGRSQQSERAAFYRAAGGAMVLKGLHLGAKRTLPKSLRRYLQMDKQIRNMYYIQSLYLVEITSRVLDEVCTLTGEHVPLSIGFIGCGRIGRGLAHKMLEAGVVPSAITVCTRRAEPLQRLIEQGVQHCVPESCAALASCRIIFLCCLPHQMGEISNRARKHITDKSVLCSLVAGAAVARIQSQFATSNVTRMMVGSGSIDRRTVRRRGRSPESSEKSLWVGGASRSRAAEMQRLERERRIAAAKAAMKEKLARQFAPTVTIPRDNLLQYVAIGMSATERVKHRTISRLIECITTTVVQNCKLIPYPEAYELVRRVVIGGDYEGMPGSKRARRGSVTDEPHLTSAEIALFHDAFKHTCAEFFEKAFRPEEREKAIESPRSLPPSPHSVSPLRSIRLPLPKDATRGFNFPLPSPKSSNEAAAVR